MHKTGYWIDLTGVQFADGEAVTWLQALPLGKYKHPLYGVINITPERVRRFAQNVKDGVRGTDLDIDYDHKQHSGKAAGWVRDAEARADGLWLAVEWTEPAREAIKNGEYRYFSPEFVDVWTHPKTSQVYKDVLFGGAITNRPFLKDILPINMSDLTGGEQVDEFLKELRDKLGLPEEATQEQILEAASKVNVESPPKPNVGDNQEEPVLASEDLIKLAETNPSVKALLDTVKTQGEAISALQAANRLSEASLQLSEWQRGSGKAKWAIPPVVAETATKCLTEMTGEVRKQFTEFVNKLLEVGLVSLKEQGKAEGEPTVTAAEAFEGKVRKLMESSEGLSYADAVVAVAAAEPALYDEYRIEYLGQEVN